MDIDFNNLNKLEKVLITTLFSTFRKIRTNFVLDLGSIKYIIARKELFSSLTSSIVEYIEVAEVICELLDFIELDFVVVYIF